MTRPLIIVNKSAARARRAWPIVRARLRAAAIEFDSYETTTAGDATVRTRAALEANCTTIAVVGGDGTLSEVAQGFFEFNKAGALPQPINLKAAMAILPAGTGNDFARGIIGRRASLENWIETLVSFLARPPATGTRLFDVLFGTCDNYTTPFICLNASTMGIGGETASRVSSQGKLMRGLSGEGRFILAAAGALVAWRERRVRISIDGREVIDGPMNLVGVANGLYAGGGMMLSPGARADDGKLDVISVSGLTRLAVVREMQRIHRGGHIENQKVRVSQAKAVRIETFAPEDALLIEADGNLRGRTPVEFRVMPKAIRFVV